MNTRTTLRTATIIKPPAIGGPRPGNAPRMWDTWQVMKALSETAESRAVHVRFASPATKLVEIGIDCVLGSPHWRA